MFILYHIIDDTDLDQLTDYDKEVLNDLKNKPIHFESSHIQEYVENQNTVDNVKVDVFLQKFLEDNILSKTLRIDYAIEKNMGLGCIDQVKTKEHFIKT